MVEQVEPIEDGDSAKRSSRGDLDAAQLAVLRLLAKRPDVAQRELSAALGLSLGKTHYVLHALLDKGLVKVRNFKRSHKKLAYAYVLTPGGFAEKLKLTRRFLLRKEAEYQALEHTISVLRQELQAQTAANSASGPSKSVDARKATKGSNENEAVR